MRAFDPYQRDPALAGSGSVSPARVEPCDQPLRQWPGVGSGAMIATPDRTPRRRRFSDRPASKAVPGFPRSQEGTDPARRERSGRSSDRPTPTAAHSQGEDRRVPAVAGRFVGRAIQDGPVLLRLTEAQDGSDSPGRRTCRVRMARNGVMSGPLGHVRVYFAHQMPSRSV